MSDRGRTAADVRIADVPDRSRFEIRVGGEVAGFTEYRRRPELIAFVHTLIDPRFEGQGLASQLVRAALSEVRSDGLIVLPFCPGHVRSPRPGPSPPRDTARGDVGQPRSRTAMGRALQRP